MTNGFSLYQLTADFRRFSDMVEAGEISPDDMADTLDALGEDIRAKLDNCIGYTKELLAQLAALKVAAAATAERIKSKQAAIDRMTAYIADCMHGCGLAKFETTDHLVTLRPSEAVVVTDEHLLMDYLRRDHPDYITTKTVETYAKKDISTLIKAGADIGGAHIEHRLNPQIK